MTDAHPLTGKFFHTTRVCNCGRPRAMWQGHILAVLDPDILLVELFDWLMGEPSGQELIRLTNFMSRDPILYDHAEDMTHSVEHGQLMHTFRSDTCDEKREVTA